MTINVRPVIVQAKLSAFCYQRDKQPVLWKLDVELLPAELPALSVHNLLFNAFLQREFLVVQGYEGNMLFYLIESKYIIKNIE